MAFDPNTYGAKSGGGFNPDTYGASTTGGPKDFNVNVSHQENLKPRARFKVTVPGLADFDPDGAFSSQEREMRIILMGEDKKKFTSAKIGDELTLSGGKAIKVSEDEIEVPDMEALQNPMESVAIGAGINSPAALAGLAAFGGVSSRVKGIPGMILGAGAGAITAAGTGFGQRKISPDALNELEAETQRRSPVGYNLGRILGSGMKPGGYSGSIGRESAERLLPAGIGAGLQAGVDAYQGKLGTPESNKEILMAAAENLILKDANKLGNKAMGSLAAKPKFKLEIPEPATDITDNLGNAKAGQPLSKTQQDANTMALGKDDLALGVQEPAPAMVHADGDVTSPAEQSALVFELQKARADEAARRSAMMQEPGMLASETELAKGAMTKAEVDANFYAENQKQVERHYQALKDLRESEARANEARKKEAELIKANDEANAVREREGYAQDLVVEIARQEGVPYDDVVATRAKHPNIEAWVEDLENRFAYGHSISDKQRPKTIAELTTLAKSGARENLYQKQQDAIAARNEQAKANVKAVGGETLEGFQPVEPKATMDFEGAPANTAKQAKEISDFNSRVQRVTENLKAEGVELDRQTAAKLALIKDPQEFNAARQQLIDSVKPPTHEIPKAGPVKSLSDLPEIAGPRDLVGPRVPDVLTPSRKKTAVAMPEVAKPVESKGIAIPEAPAKLVVTPERAIEAPKAPDLSTSKIEDIDAWHSANEDFDKNIDVAVFGEAKAREYRKLQRTANGPAGPKAENAWNKIQEMEGALSQSQRDILFGRNLPEGWMNPDSSKRLRNIAAEIDSAQDAGELASASSRVIQGIMGDVSLGKKPSQQQTQLFNRIKAKASDLGVTNNELVSLAFADRAKSQGSDVFELSGTTEQQFRDFMGEPAQSKKPAALDAKEAIIQDPNLDADTKIEILQKMATAKPKRDKQTLAQKLLARKKEVEATKAKPVEPVAEPTPEPIKEAPVVEESAPTDPLGDKLAYLDEQLASKEITKAEHKQLVKEAKATVTPRTAKNKQAGFSSGAVMANMAAPAVGAAIGSNIGDTPEERVRNAMIGAGIASGSTASLTALANMIKKNPNILKEFKDGFSSAKEANAKQPSLTEQVNAPEPATPSTPDGIGADAALGNMGKSPVWNGGVLKKFPLLADLAEKFTTHIDSLYEVSPKLAGAMRNWMYESSKLLSEATTRSVSPLTRLREFVGKEEFEGRIWGLLREGREADVLASLDKAGPEGKSIADGLRDGWIKDRPEMLEMLRQANPGKVVYVDGQPTYPNQNIGELDNYWPSFVEDLDGLRKAMGTKYKSDIDVAIAKRKETMRQAEADEKGVDTSQVGEPSLSDTEIGDIITGILTKPSTQGNTPGMGNTKKRTIKEIPAELRKFYAPPDLALAKYYQRAFDSALSKKYTGKANPDGTLEFYGKENAGIFGDILIDGMNDKSIDPKGAQRAVENINSFGKNPDSWKISRVLAPKIAYLQVAGNLAQASSAITQLADVIQTIANTSAKDTFGGFFIDPIIKGKRFKRLEDIGVQEGITEFYEHSKTSGTASWVMDNVFLPLFKPTDKFMKQGIANSNLRFLESGLKAQESGKPTGYRFDIASDRYKSMQGIEEWNKLADAVKRGEWDSDVVNKFAFNRLSDVQPITKAEQAIGKSQLGAGGKIAFGLTGFMLRQMNTLRSNAVGAWRKGDKWDAAKYVAGFLTAQAVAGYTIGTIKGWINGDDDAGVNNIGNVILATFGLNRFMFNQAYDKDFSSIVGERILPGVFSPAKDIISDIGLARDMVTGEKSGSFLEQSEFAKRAPLVGDIYYKNAGAGKEKREKRERSGAESPNDLEKLYDLIEGVDNRKRGSR